MNIHPLIFAMVQGAVAPTPLFDWDSFEANVEQATEPWMVLEEVSTEEIQASFGASTNRFEEYRTYNLVIMVESTQSVNDSRDLAETARDALRTVKITSPEIIRIDSVAPPQLGTNFIGKWRSTEFTLSAVREFYRPTI